MDKFSDAQLKQMTANIAVKGKLTIGQAYQLLIDLRDQIVPVSPVVTSQVFQWHKVDIEKGYILRGSRVVYDEMSSYEGVVTEIRPYVSDGKISAIFDIKTPDDYEDWIGAERILWIKDPKGNILWQDACVNCRRPALYTNDRFLPVCEYCV